MGTLTEPIQCCTWGFKQKLNNRQTAACCCSKVSELSSMFYSGCWHKSKCFKKWDLCILYIIWEKTRVSEKLEILVTYQNNKKHSHVSPNSKPFTNHFGGNSSRDGLQNNERADSQTVLKPAAAFIQPLNWENICERCNGVALIPSYYLIFENIGFQYLKIYCKLFVRFKNLPLRQSKILAI